MIMVKNIKNQNPVNRVMKEIYCMVFFNMTESILRVVPFLRIIFYYERVADFVTFIRRMNMGKKKKTIDLLDRKIIFLEKKELFRVLSLNLNSMDVEVSISVEGEKKRVKKMPFAHLPKPIKKMVRPL
jgi:hypothetical protein